MNTNTKTKREKVCTKEVDAEAGTVTFAFAGEEQPVVVKREDFAESIQMHLLFHGIGQKLGDSYSGARSVAEARGLFEKALQALKDGTWNMRGEGGGGRSPDVVEALALHQGVELAQAQEVWDGLTDEQKKQVKAHPEIKRRVMEIRLARETEKAKEVKETVDLGGLFK